MRVGVGVLVIGSPGGEAARERLSVQLPLNDPREDAASGTPTTAHPYKPCKLEARPHRVRPALPWRLYWSLWMRPRVSG